MIKGIIFDMDGVIIDSEPIYKKVNKKLYKKFGLKLKEKDFDRYRGANLKDIWQDILSRYQVAEEYQDYELEDFVEAHIYNSYQGLKAAEDLKLISGLKNWLNFLKDHGYKMIIASSSYKPVIEYIYQRFDLDQYMEGYVDGNSIENGKPAPDIFIKAAAEMGFKAEECLIIEDSEHGVNAAQAAGAEVIAFNGAEDPSQDLSQADIIIKEYNQENLNKILGR